MDPQTPAPPETAASTSTRENPDVTNVTNANTPRNDSPSPSRVIQAAGGVLWRHLGSETEELYGLDTPIEVAVVHRPKYDDWSFPKGKLEAGESLPGTAVREIAEETGVQACLGPQLGVFQYQVEGTAKEVTYWLASARQSPAVMAREYIKPAPVEEIDELRWVPLDEVHTLLSYDFDRELARLAKSRLGEGWGASKALILLRHAKAKNPLKWEGADQERPLKKRGKRQAVQLRAILSAFGVARVWASPWKRCRQSVKPFLKAAGIQAIYSEIIGDEGQGRFPQEFRGLLQELSVRCLEAGSTVVCSHEPALATWQRMLGPEFLEQTLVGLRPGEALVLHLLRTPEGAGKIIAVERHLAQG